MGKKSFKIKNSLNLKSVLLLRKILEKSIHQKSAKTALLINANKQGRFYTFLDELILSSFFLKKTDFKMIENCEAESVLLRYRKPEYDGRHTNGAILFKT